MTSRLSLALLAATLTACAALTGLGDYELASEVDAGIDAAVIDGARLDASTDAGPTPTDGAISPIDADIGDPVGVQCFEPAARCAGC